MKRVNRLNIWCVIAGAALLVSAPAGAEDKGAAKPVMYDDGGRRDPMWSLVNASGAIVSYDQDFQITDMVLEGIMAGDGGGENVAVINGNIVAPNDSVGVFVVREIHPTYILIEKGNESFILKLKKEE